MLTRYDPFREALSLRRAMDQLLEQSFVPNLMNIGAPSIVAPMDICETPNGYEVEVALPGVKPEDIELTVDQNSLTIRGHYSHQNEHREHLQGQVPSQSQISSQSQATQQQPQGQGQAPYQSPTAQQQGQQGQASYQSPTVQQQGQGQVPYQASTAQQQGQQGQAPYQSQMTQQPHVQSQTQSQPDGQTHPQGQMERYSQGYNWLTREIVSGSFERTINFARPIDADRIETSYDQGILTIIVPVSEASRPRRINVSGSKSQQTVEAGRH